MSRYQMVYLSGGGTEYNGGLWDIQKTAKMTIFRLLEQSFFPSNCPETMRIKDNKERTHCLRNWNDGTFTVYPYQSGVPHIFEPVSTPPKSKESKK